MRRFLGMCLVGAGMVWFGSVSAHADENPGRVVNSNRSGTSSVLSLSDRTPTPAARGTTTESEPRTISTATGTQTRESAAEEKKILGKVKGYAALLVREEKLLAQRMAYAAKLRAQGLEKEDRKLLDQAEDYERRSMAAYLSRVKQFEKAQFSGGVRQPTATTPARRPSNSTTPRTQSGSSSTRTPRSANSRSSNNIRRTRPSRSYGR